MISTEERVVYRTKQPKRKRSWRDRPDSLNRGFDSMPRAESLSPTARTISRAAAGDPQAMAIIDSWRSCLGWQHLVVKA